MWSSEIYLECYFQMYLKYAKWRLRKSNHVSKERTANARIWDRMISNKVSKQRFLWIFLIRPRFGPQIWLLSLQRGQFVFVKNIELGIKIRVRKFHQIFKLDPKISSLQGVKFKFWGSSMGHITNSIKFSNSTTQKIPYLIARLISMAES